MANRFLGALLILILVSPCFEWPPEAQAQGQQLDSVVELVSAEATQTQYGCCSTNATCN